MYAIFLCDAALGLYFNTGPQFDTLEIRLPLPADDAAWEGRDDTECGEAARLVMGPSPRGRGIQTEHNDAISLRCILS